MTFKTCQVCHENKAKELLLLAKKRIVWISAPKPQKFYSTGDGQNWVKCVANRIATKKSGSIRFETGSLQNTVFLVLLMKET